MISIEKERTIWKISQGNILDKISKGDIIVSDIGIKELCIVVNENEIYTLYRSIDEEINEVQRKVHEGKIDNHARNYNYERKGSEKYNKWDKILTGAGL